MKFKLMTAVLGTLAVSACAAPMTFQAPMSSSYEVPPTLSRGVGGVTAVVYPSTLAMTYTAEYKDLTGPATAAHIHGPAAMGTNGPVAFPAVVTPSPITGGATLTPAQFADLQAGKYYFNVHTATNPGGEIRGTFQRVR